MLHKDASLVGESTSQAFSTPTFTMSCFLDTSNGLGITTIILPESMECHGEWTAEQDSQQKQFMVSTERGDTAGVLFIGVLVILVAGMQPYLNARH